jgi:hypothetical protein
MLTSLSQTNESQCSMEGYAISLLLTFSFSSDVIRFDDLGLRKFVTEVKPAFCALFGMEEAAKHDVRGDILL